MQNSVLTFNGELTKNRLQFSPNALENCLRGLENGSDKQQPDPLGMSLLTQAMQPDKIFDLPLALVKV